MNMLDVERELVVWGVAYQVTGVVQFKSSHFRTIRSTRPGAKDWIILDSEVTPLKDHMINKYLNPHRTQDSWHLAAIRIDRVRVSAINPHKYSYIQAPEQGIKTYTPEPSPIGGSS